MDKNIEMTEAITEAMIAAPTADSATEEAEADVQGYSYLLSAISSVMGSIGTNPSLFDPVHTATPVYTGGGSTGGSSGGTTRLN